jgi:hypothetical protein
MHVMARLHHEESRRLHVHFQEAAQSYLFSWIFVDVAREHTGFYEIHRPILATPGAIIDNPLKYCSQPLLACLSSILCNLVRQKLSSRDNYRTV